MARCSYCRGEGWIGDGTPYMPRARCHLWPKCTPQPQRMAGAEDAQHSNEAKPLSLSESTDTEIVVYIHATSACPVCRKRVEIKRQLDELALVTCNTTEMASYHARELRSLVQAEIISRGWTGEMCGSCRDQAPVERDKRGAHKR